MSRSDSADNLLGLHAQAQQPLHPAPAPHLNGDSDNEQAGGNDDNAVAAAAGAASDDEHKSASDGELYLNSDEEASGAQQGWGRQNTVAQRRVQFWQALKMKEVRESRIRRHTMGRKAEAVPVQEEDDADLDVSGLHGMFEMDEVDEYLAEEDQVTGYVRASDYYSPALRPWQYAIRLPAFDPDQPDTQAYRNAEVLGRWLAAHFGEESVRIRPQGSVDKESAYISIAASKEHLEELAERSKLRVRVNSWIGKGYHHYTRKAHHEKHFRIPGTELQTEEEFDAFLEAHQFSPDMPEEVMVLLPYQRQQLVLREIHSVLDRLKGLPEGSMKGMQVMIKDEELFDVFPLHTLHHEETVTDNYPSRHTVLREYCGWRTSWMTVCMWTKKSNDFLDFMRDYMGEKLALYFAFLHFYTSWLMMLAVAGSFIAIWQYSRGPDNFGVPIYCCLVALWSTIMLEYWQRRNAQLAHRWDMYDYEVREAEIENFATKVQKKYCGFYEKHGAWVDMEVWLNKQGENADEYREFVAHTHKDENGRCPPCFFWCFKPEQRLEYNTKCWRFFKVSISTTIVLCFVTGVAFVSLMWLFVRLIIQETDEQLGGSITGSMNAISILILDFLFESIAVRLNDWEGHRTATQYEDHLIAKQFFFQAVNSYFTLFYIAFFKAGPFTRGTPELFGRDDRCKDSSGEPTDSCMYELALQLTAMLITRMLLANIIEAALPKLRMWWAIRKRMQPTLKKIKWRMPNATKAEIERELRKEGMYAHVGVAEKQAHQPEYSNGLQVSGVYADMLELAIQFGYVTLFAPAFPLAPALAVLNNVIENRLDGWKVLIQCQKPDYRGARDIGTWLTVFQFLSLVGVMTNMGIVAFTSTQLDDIMNNPSDAQKLVVIIVAEHLILLVKFYFTVLIPIEPRHVRVDVAEELEIRRVLQAHTRTVEYLETHKEETKRHPSMLASQIDFAKLVYNKREMRDMDKANELIAGMDDHTKELAARELGKTGDEEVALEDVAAREQERIEAEKAAKKAAAEAEKAAADEEPEDAGQDQE